MLNGVVGRLLGPMTQVTPVLVQGNTWDGNVTMSRGSNGRVILLNATPLWAPAEYEWAPWWAGIAQSIETILLSIFLVRSIIIPGPEEVRNSGCDNITYSSCSTGQPI